MARAYPDMQSQEFSQSPGEWQALRGELVALLDQVESQVARQSRSEHGLSGVGERLRDLRMQVEDVAPDDRHREALRTVKRAVDRFNDRDEALSDRPMPANPRDTLQSAIQQIRSRHVPAAAPQPSPPQHRPLELPQVTELAHAVGGISHRLERLEAELRNQARSQTGNVKDIADQVAQLSHVVELLAGAVGETGQVKRLEGQIASLARLVAQGPQVDLSSLTQRLDDVSATVGKLADLQVQYAGKVANSDKSASLVSGMRAIEDGVRNVYDRIDAIERQAPPNVDLEPVTRELARITEAMQGAGQPQTLVDLVDLLNQRISDLETRNPAVAELKLDVEDLRRAVESAIEPRFASLEMQIETLTGRLDDRPQHDLNISQLEAQVRQLVNRMDQTGEQLSGLARLYQQPVAQPDFDALADLVASRASNALARTAPVLPPPPDYDEIERRLGNAMRAQAPAYAPEPSTDYEEIEKRLARVMRAAAAEQAPPEDFSLMRSGISEVNERLSRLEQSLTRRAEEGRKSEAPAIARFTAPMPSEAAPVAEPPRPMPPPLSPMPAARKPDTMPESPATDRPLTARPFGDPTDTGPVRTALEAKNGPRRHPGLTDSEPAPAYTPASVAKPPRPASSLEAAAVAPPPTPAAAVAAPAPAVDMAAPAPEAMPSANTFIQAHRRAARQASAPAKANDRTEPASAPVAGQPTSLIGRALARLQGSAATAAAAPEVKPAEAMPTADAPQAVEPDATRPRRGIRRLAGDKAPRGPSWSAEDEPAAAPATPGDAAVSLDPVDDGEHETPTESFLTRYRRPILLAAVLVAATFLAANLVVQKLGESAPRPATTVGTAPMPEPIDGVPTAEVSTLTAPSPVLELVDTFQTGSIGGSDATAPMAFVPSPAARVATPAAPAAALAVPAEDALATEALLASLDAPLAVPAPLQTSIGSPVRVDMPPETIGPEALRQAAANGDPRAQFEVAAIYTEGRVVHEDLEQAAVWYERAAAQGFAPAQYRLGNLYENGKGVETDLQQARLWYQQAAEAGNRMAMHNLAALYASGGLGSQQFDAAAEWFEQAADRGMTDSQFNLGMLFARGLGVKQDMPASYKWFSLAALRGDKDAAAARDDLARSLSAEEVQRINAELADWKPQSVAVTANYAPIGTWSPTFDPGEPITKLEIVKSVQTLLTQLGYDTGTPDGQAGPKTTEAIRAFERAAGMIESGSVNPRLLAVLGSQPV
jgi:localization factor PodJL